MIKNNKLYLSTSKENIMLFDNETVNNDRIIVDFSGAIINPNFIEKERFGFIIKEVWEDKELMSGIYATERKKEIWRQQLETGEKKLISVYQLIKWVNETIKKYDLKIIGAYNVSFDKSAYNKTLKHFNAYEKADKIRYLKPLDIWKVVEPFIIKKHYVKYCLDNNFLTDKGNPKSSAEILYKYLSEELGFVETHIADQDIDIEIKILIACVRKVKYFELKKQNALELVQQFKKFMPKKA